MDIASADNASLFRQIRAFDFRKQAKDFRFVLFVGSAHVNSAVKGIDDLFNRTFLSAAQNGCGKI